MALPPSAPAPAMGAEQRISKMLQKDLRDYWKDPLNKVLNDPIRAIIYSIAIKALCLIFALFSGFIGYSLFGISIALIERIIFNNFTLFFHSIIRIFLNLIDIAKDFVANVITAVVDEVKEEFFGE